MKTKEDRFGESHYIDDFEGYDEGNLKSLFDGLVMQMRQAEAAGFTKVFVHFSSTLEPYEDMLGPVEIQIRGERPLNKSEETVVKESERIAALAARLGVNYYEAEVIDRAMKAGKVAANE